MGKIAVVGGGAAGMIAAIFAARNGNHVEVFEKNEKLGKKLYITGKGRCNLTNSCEMEELLEAVVTNKKFLYSSFYGFTNEETMDFFSGNRPQNEDRARRPGISGIGSFIGCDTGVE